MRLQDRIVVITGAGSGLGRAGALASARAGARVVVSDLDPASTEATISAIEGAGGEAIGVPADAGDRAQAKHLIAESVARFGGLDVLYNNAGIAPVGRDGFTPQIAEDAGLRPARHPGQRGDADERADLRQRHVPRRLRKGSRDGAPAARGDRGARRVATGDRRDTACITAGADAVPPSSRVLPAARRR